MRRRSWKIKPRVKPRFTPKRESQRVQEQGSDREEVTGREEQKPQADRVEGRGRDATEVQQILQQFQVAEGAREDRTGT